MHATFIHKSKKTSQLLLQIKLNPYFSGFLVHPRISTTARSEKLSGSLTCLLDGSQVTNLFWAILSNTKFALYFNRFALLQSQINPCLKDSFPSNSYRGQVLHHRGNWVPSNIQRLLQLQLPHMSNSPTSPGKKWVWKPCTNLFLRSVHLWLSDKLLFCCVPYSKQGQEPLVTLALSLPKELCACRKDTHVSSAPGIHSAQ